MTPQLTWTREAGTLMLAGELDQDVLTPLWDARVEAMTGVTRIDMSQISRVDTGGLALLAHLVNQAKKQGNAVSLSGVNDKVYALAQLYNLPEDVLPPYVMNAGWRCICLIRPTLHMISVGRIRRVSGAIRHFYSADLLA
ncbi:sulfate transporter [Salmonella enterica subsp. arizonae]|uniref:Sulfate transporter n=1 Tax=Salmonella enterica subsp. arizonae TaxID=59203 RepID=A0A379RWR3_SALER|nr:sulfate transporter [Salmonella enterica subsp. arizonae]